MLPPAEATLVWALSTPHEDIRCLTWQHGSGWMVGIYFGVEALDIELAPSREAMHVWGDAVRRKLIALGFGEGGRLGGHQPPRSMQSAIVLPGRGRGKARAPKDLPKGLTETDDDL